MAYDRDLAVRIRDELEGEPGLSEKAMFGGLAFLLDGNMAVAASSKGGLLLRVDPADTATLVEEPGAQRFEMRGREMDGWLDVDGAVLADPDSLRRWLEIGVSYARSLPAK